MSGVVLSDLGERQQIFIALDRLRRDAWAILNVGRVVWPEYLSGTAPFQDQVHVRALLFDFLSHFAFTLLEWADRTEAEVRMWDARTNQQRERAAIARIRHVLDEYPVAREGSESATET